MLCNKLCNGVYIQYLRHKYSEILISMNKKKPNVIHIVDLNEIVVPEEKSTEGNNIKMDDTCIYS